MKFFIVLISDIPSQSNDKTFVQFINKNGIEYWRYFALNWILATPDSFEVSTILKETMEAYGGGIHAAVFEADIKTMMGVLPVYNKPMNELHHAFTWFETMRNKDYKPKWEREGSNLIH